MYVVKVYADNQYEFNCSEWRDLTVADAVNKAAADGRKPGWKAKLIHVSSFGDYLNPAIQDLIGPCDVITVQRNIITEGVFDAIRYWQGMGKPVIADIDDAYNILPYSNPAHRFWIQNVSNLNPKPTVMLEKGLSLCDALTSPNRLILADWAHVVKGYHIQNYARQEWWTDLPTRATRKHELGLQDRVVIGWGGSVSHYDSWWGSGIREAATAICRKHPEVVWMICGNDPRIFEQLPVPLNQKYQQGGVSAQEWPKIVCTFDIGVAPLYGFYDQRRSWIKTLEYGLAGVPWAATAGEPYADHAYFGNLVEGTPDAWYMALETLIRNLSAEQEVAAARIAHYQQWFIGNQLDAYAKVFKEVMNCFMIDRGQLPAVHYVNWEKEPVYA